MSVSTPLISILMVTYNHAPYIEQAMKSVLEQQTEYSFQLVVCDDASTDQTASIVKSYQKKYKNLVFIQQPVNGRGINNHFDGYRYIKSKYIAFCEGDDFWTSKDKLQKQVEFLENNPDFNVCCHKVEIQLSNTTSNKKQFVYKNLNSDIPRIRNGIFYAEELIDNYYMHTSSFVFRYKLHDGIPSWMRKWMIFDHGIFMLHAHESKTKYFDEVMSVWRRNETGFSWLQNVDKSLFFQKEGHGWIRIYQEMDHFFKKKYHEQIKKRIVLSLRNMLENHISNGNHYLAKNLVAQYSEWCTDLSNQDIEFNKLIHDLKSLNENLDAPWSEREKEEKNYRKCELTNKLNNYKYQEKTLHRTQKKYTYIIDLLYTNRVKSLWIPNIYDLELADTLNELNILHQIYPADLNLNPTTDFLQLVNKGDAIITKNWQNQNRTEEFNKKINKIHDVLLIEDLTDSIYRQPSENFHYSIYKSQEKTEYIFYGKNPKAHPSDQEPPRKLLEKQKNNSIANKKCTSHAYLDLIQEKINLNWETMNNKLQAYSFQKIENIQKDKSEYFPIFLPLFIPQAFFITAMRHVNVLCQIVPNNSKDISHLTLLTHRIVLIPCGHLLSQENVLKICEEVLLVINGKSPFGKPGTRPA